MGRWDGKLEGGDVKRARKLADRRASRVRREGLGHGHGEAGRGHDQVSENHWFGALAEVAYSRHTGQPLPSEDEFGEGDFGRLQVRGTRYASGSLIVFLSEPVDVPYCLVVVQPDRGYRYRIAGYISGARARAVGREPGTEVRSGSPEQVWVEQRDLRTAPVDRERLL